MKATVVAVTRDLENKDLGIDFLEENKIFSGKMAGICYQKDKYFGTSVSDPEKAEPRFHRVANTNHHSIALHSTVTVLFEDISKMLAMVLNSLNYYNTSEKSGRYTEMKANSEDERKLYTKWVGILHKCVLDEYPDYDDFVLKSLMVKEGHDDVIIINGELSNNNMADDDEVHQSILAKCKQNMSLPSWKIAQDNARFMLSIFTKSTTMSYTTSLAQWNYIYDWCADAIPRCNERSNDYFYEQLGLELAELANFIRDNLYVEELRDSKGRYFDFLVDLYKDKNPVQKFDNNVDEHIGFAYSTSYDCSVVSLAQLQRHRTLKYYMRKNSFFDNFYYVPDLIKKDKDLEYEWLNDLNSINFLYPQAMIVNAVEVGTLPNLVLKCTERLCGRAAVETMRHTKDVVQKFIDNYDKLSVFEQSYVDKLKSDGSITTKCKLCNCKEPCYWGSTKALTRDM